MHKISKILNQQSLSLEELKEIKLMWDRITFSTQKTKADCFYKQSRKHLSPEKKFCVESISSSNREKFNNFLKVMKEEQIFIKKEELARLIKIKSFRKKSPQIDMTIEKLLFELKEERNFLREISDSLEKLGLATNNNKVLTK